MSIPLISVIIPLYNKESSIKQTIISVLSQTYIDFELIIVNDGSKDNSLELVKSIPDSRIKIIDKKNEGVSKTRNRGALEAKGKLLFFLDADDIILPNCLDVLIKIHNMYPNADLWSANYYNENNNNRSLTLSLSDKGYIKKPHKSIYFRKWIFRTGTYIISKDSFFTIGCFPTNIQIGEDWYFLDKYCERFTCVYVPIPVMAYVQDSRSLSKSKINIKKTVEWHLVSTGKNKWQKLSYSENILKRVICSLLQSDYNGALTLAYKKMSILPLGIIATIISQIYRYHNSRKLKRTINNNGISRR